MEEIIKRSFCNYCLNKGNKCLEIQTEEKRERIPGQIFVSEPY